MGSRYDFELTVNLRENAPDEVVQALTFLLRPGERVPAVAPDDPFFEGNHWRDNPFANWAIEVNPHAGDAVCSFRRVNQRTVRGVDRHQYTLHLRFSDKLETVAEVALPFAMWLAKWSDQNECVGHYKGEEDRHPTLLYFHDGELYLRRVIEPPQRATDAAYWN